MIKIYYYICSVLMLAELMSFWDFYEIRGYKFFNLKCGEFYVYEFQNLNVLLFVLQHGTNCATI